MTIENVSRNYSKPVPGQWIAVPGLSKRRSSADQGNTCIVLTRWQDQDSFRQWVKSDEYKEGRQRMDHFRNPDGKMRLTSQVEMFEAFAEQGAR